MEGSVPQAQHTLVSFVLCAYLRSVGRRALGIDGHRAVPAWPGGPACRVCSGPHRAIIVPRAGGMAQGTARGPSGQPEGTAGQRAKAVPGRRPIFSFFRISRLYFLTGHSGWMNRSTDLYFLFFIELKNYIFYWTIKHRAVGPCLSRGTGHSGSPGTAWCLSPCQPTSCMANYSIGRRSPRPASTGVRWYTSNM